MCWLARLLVHARRRRRRRLHMLWPNARETHFIRSHVQIIHAPGFYDFCLSVWRVRQFGLCLCTRQHSAGWPSRLQCMFPNTVCRVVLSFLCCSSETPPSPKRQIARLHWVSMFVCLCVTYGMLLIIVLRCHQHQPGGI